MEVSEETQPGEGAFDWETVVVMVVMVASQMNGMVLKLLSVVRTPPELNVYIHGIRGGGGPSGIGISSSLSIGSSFSAMFVPGGGPSGMAMSSSESPIGFESRIIKSVSIGSNSPPWSLSISSGRRADILSQRSRL